MQVFVRTLSGKAVVLQVQSSETIGGIKSSIQARDGLPRHHQRLIHEGRQLDDGRTLADYQITSEATLHLVASLRGGKPVSLTIRPRIQKDKWSLYWKESMETKTELLDEYTMQADTATTVTALQQEVSKSLGWRPEDQLLRLEGFKDPWDFSVHKGRTLKPHATLEENGITGDAMIVTVRRVLVAEGWKIVTGGDEDSSTDEDDF